MKNGLGMDISNSGGRIQLRTLREKHLDTLNSCSSRVGQYSSRPHSHIDSKVKSRKKEIVEAFSGGHTIKQYYLKAKNATSRIDCTEPKTLGRKEFISKFKFQQNRHDEVERTHIRGTNHIIETIAGLQQQLMNHRVTLQQKSQLNQTYLTTANGSNKMYGSPENSQITSTFSQSSRRNQTLMSLFQNSSQESPLQRSRNSQILLAQDSVIVGCHSPLLSPILSSLGDSPTTRPILQLSRTSSGIDSYRPKSAQLTNNSIKETFLSRTATQPTSANEYWGGRDFVRIKKKNCYLEQCKRTDVNYDVLGTQILKEINRIQKKIVCNSNKQLGSNGKLSVYDLAINNGYEGLKRYMLNIAVEHSLFSVVSLQALAKLLHNQQPHLDKMKLIQAAKTLEKELLRNSSQTPSYQQQQLSESQILQSPEA